MLLLNGTLLGVNKASMLKIGFILTYRIIARHLSKDLLSMMAIVADYIWLINEITTKNWLGILGAAIVLITLLNRALPFSNNKSLQIIKLFGLSDFQLNKLAIVYTFFVALIVNLISLGLLGLLNHATETLLNNNTINILLSSMLMFCLLFINYIKGFKQVQPSF